MRIWFSTIGLLCAMALCVAEAGTFLGVSHSKDSDIRAVVDSTDIINDVADGKNGRKLISVAAPNSSNNKIANPGFEDGTLNPWYANSANMTVLLDSTQAHSGARSVLCKDRTADWMAVQQDITALVVPNETYRFSCWAKLKNSASDVVKMTLKIVDDDGPHWKAIETTANDGAWTFVDGEMNVDVTGVMAGVYLFMMGPASGVEYWIDDVSVVSLSSNPPTPSLRWWIVLVWSITLTWVGPHLSVWD
mmetsp:Transcript_30966/g.74834  ORF Transcript_30966/g.74834 Transcript_30966/m.74834 type:complete len:248 (+) Transcript_30966:585-1328(+)